jgi:hypothetical protein
MGSNPISESVDSLLISEELKAEIKDALLPFSPESDFLDMFRNMGTIIEVQFRIKDIFQHISVAASWQMSAIIWSLGEGRGTFLRIVSSLVPAYLFQQ